MAGWLIWTMLRRDRGMSEVKAGAFAALWLWNPMVATISTRGSSEGLLGVLTIALLWSVERRRLTLAAVLLGLGVHFKIYPFIYAVAIIWWMDDEHLGKSKSTIQNEKRDWVEALDHFITMARVKLAVISLGVFMALNILMYLM